jgi:TolB protein
MSAPIRLSALSLASCCIAGLSGCAMFQRPAPVTAPEPAPTSTAMSVDEATRGPRFVGGERVDLPAPESTMLVALFGETGAGPVASGANSERNLQQVSFALEGGDFTPDIDPEGRTLIYASRQHSERFDLYRKSVGGRTVTQLTSDPADDMMPAISPDGTRIAFVSNRAGNWDVYVMPAEGGAPTQITFDRDDEVQPTWSPDGSTLAFARRNRRTDRWEIWTADTKLPGSTTYLCDGFLPRWRPNPSADPKQNKLLFQRARQQGSRLFGVWTVDILDGQATNPTEIVSAQDAAVVQPAWSPDGSHIVFTTIMDPTGDAAGHADLWIIKADGSGRINLTSDRFRNMQPVWSRNDRIYFVSNRSGVDNIWCLTATPRPMAGPTAVPVQHHDPQHQDHHRDSIGSGGIAGVGDTGSSQP